MRHVRRSTTLVMAGAVGVALLAGGCNDSNTPSAAKTPATPAPTPTPTPTPSDNGIAAKTPTQILDAMSKAMKAASSTHVQGKAENNGQTLQLDLHVGSNQSTGSMVVPVKGTEAHTDIIAVNGKIYLRGRELWRAAGGATAEQLIGDRWGIMPPSAADSYQSFASLGGISDNLLKPKGTVTKEKHTTVDGQPVLGLRDSADGSILYVATTGEPYPIEVLPAPAKAKPGEKVTFSEWNAPLTVTAPTDAIDLSKLGNQA